MRIVRAAPVILLLLSTVGCSSSQRRRAPLPAPPATFHPAKVAWKLLVAETPDLAPPSGRDETRLEKALRSFYGVVGRKRPRTMRPDRRRSCRQAWNQLRLASRSSRELADQLTIAKAYVANECGFPQKSLRFTRKLAQGRTETDLLFYAAHFFWAEALLERGHHKSAVERYRYVLGELETPLYPLALYRTAHCYWEAGDAERAKEFLGHVVDWSGDRTHPGWVVAMRERALREHRDFTE